VVQNAGRGGGVPVGAAAPSRDDKGKSDSSNDSEKDSKKRKDKDDHHDEIDWGLLDVSVSTHWSSSPSNTCNQFIKWIRAHGMSEHDFLAEYKHENGNWSGMNPWLKGSLEIGAATAAGAVVGLVAGPIGSLIGAIGGAIAGLIGVLATSTAGHHAKKGEDRADREMREEKLRTAHLARQERIQCIQSSWDESNARADVGQDPRTVLANSKDGTQGNMPQDAIPTSGAVSAPNGDAR
jgi:hypothetical protein